MSWRSGATGSLLAAPDTRRKESNGARHVGVEGYLVACDAEFCVDKQVDVFLAINTSLMGTLLRLGAPIQRPYYS